MNRRLSTKASLKRRVRLGFIFDSAAILTRKTVGEMQDPLSPPTVSQLGTSDAQVSDTKDTSKIWEKRRDFFPVQLDHSD